MALARNTGTFDTAPASLSASATIPGGGGVYLRYAINATWSGTFLANKVYILEFWAASRCPDYVAIGGQLLPGPVVVGRNRLGWVPTTDMTNPTLELGGFVRPQAYLQLFSMFLDSFSMSRADDTLPTRRGFSRTKQLQVAVTLPTDGVAAAAIGDLWLAQNSFTPCRGTANFNGPRSLRDRLTGQPVPLRQLLADTGELIHFPNMYDPDTGAIGRNGRIANVSYSPATDVAVVAIDSNRSDFDALMGRLLVTGSQVTG